MFTRIGAAAVAMLFASPTIAQDCSKDVAAGKSLEALDALQGLAEIDPQLAQQMAAEMQADINAAMIEADVATPPEVCAIYDDMIFVLDPTLDPLPELEDEG